MRTVLVQVIEQPEPLLAA